MGPIIGLWPNFYIVFYGSGRNTDPNQSRQHLTKFESAFASLSLSLSTAPLDRRRRVLDCRRRPSAPPSVSDGFVIETGKRGTVR